MNWNAPSDKRAIYNRRWTLESHRMSISILPLVLLGNLFASKLVLDFGSNFECGEMCQKKLAKALNNIAPTESFKISDLTPYFKI